MTDPQITAVDVAAWLDAARDEDLIELEACMSLTDRAQQVIALRRASRPDPQTAADAAERLDDAALREWLDNRHAEVERDHRDGWTGRTCYCDVPKPCADRAYELAAIDTMRVLLADRARMAAELEQVRGVLLARLGDAYTSGWYDAIAAVRTPDMYQREEAWTAYRVAREKAWGLATRPAATPTPTGNARTPEQWCAEYGIDIRDPDGWRGKGDPPWEQPITLPDFFRRAVRLTCWRVTTDVWNRLSREAHEAADAECSDAEGAGKGPESHAEAPA